MWKVIIIEDDKEIRELMAAHLKNHLKTEYVLKCSRVEQLIELLQDGYRPDTLLMDLHLPGMSGMDGIRFVKKNYPECDIMVFTVFNDTERIFQAIEAGAVGYLLKSTPLDQVVLAIQEMKAGGSPMSPSIARKVLEKLMGKSFPTQMPEEPLSEREQEIVIGLVDGLSYKMIADRLEISLETVRFHIKNVYRKMHVHSKAEVIARSLRKS